MATPLMPKATALWLIENTILTFQQIANFCNIHFLEVQMIADGESCDIAVPFDPVTHQQLTMEEIKRCEQDPSAQLILSDFDVSLPERKNERKYTPRAKRIERPDAIAWLLRNTPQIADVQIMKLVGTTKETIESIRNRSHSNYANITPRCPITLGLCKQRELDRMLLEAEKAK